MRRSLSATAALAALCLSLSPAAAGDLPAFDAARLPSSDGGSVITDVEAQHLATAVGHYGADEAILGIVVAYVARHEGDFASDSGYTLVINHLRERVAGLAVSLTQAPGFTVRRVEADGPLLLTLSAHGDERGGPATAVDYAGVDLVYSWDNWETTRAVSLDRASGGDYTAQVFDAPTEGRLQYAIHLWGADGRDFWLNNGRDLGVYGGAYFLNYSLALRPVMSGGNQPSYPAFAKLVMMFKHPESTGGSVITNSELSLLVEQLTWEGGPGVDDPDAIRPALSMLHSLAEDRADFEAHALDNLVGFLEAQMLPTATFPGVAFGRGAGGQLVASMQEQPAISATIFYSTDGWNLPHATECSRSTPDAPLTCMLGYLPPGAFISYAIVVRNADGSERWIRSALGNFFHKL